MKREQQKQLDQARAKARELGLPTPEVLRERAAEEMLERTETGETTAEAMLRSIETAKRLMENAARERPTRRDGYLGCFVI